MPKIDVLGFPSPLVASFQCDLQVLTCGGSVKEEIIIIIIVIQPLKLLSSSKSYLLSHNAEQKSTKGQQFKTRPNLAFTMMGGLHRVLRKLFLYLRYFNTAYINIEGLRVESLVSVKS